MATKTPSTQALLEHAEFLRALARSLLADSAAADDVVQDTMLRALERPPARRDNLRGWLGRVARNFALLQRRSRIRRGDRERAVARPLDGTPASEVAARVEVQSLVADAVRDLDEPYRTAIVLRFYDGLPPKEIAQRTGVPASTVYTRLERALDRLRQRLDGKHGGNRRAWSLALAPLLVPNRTAAAAAAGATLVNTKHLIAALLVLAIGATVAGWHFLAGTTESTPVRTARDPVRTARDDVHEPGTGPTPAQPTDEPDTDPSAAAPDSTKILVRVVHRGLPVAGAKVMGFDKKGRKMALGPTDEEGRHAIDREAVTIGATHTDYGPARKEITGCETEILLELSDPLHVDLVVLDKDTGHAVAGARVFVLYAGRDGLEGSNLLMWSALTQENMPEAVAISSALDVGDFFTLFEGNAPLVDISPIETDGAGRVRIGALPAGRLNAVIVDDHHVVHRLRDVEIGGPTTTVRLETGGGLTVTAPRLGGESTEGLVCHVMRQSVQALPVAMDKFDADGRLAFPHLMPGTYLVSILKPGDRSIMRAGVAFGAGLPSERPLAARSVEIKRGEMTLLDFAERTTTIVHGRLIGGDAEPPIAGAYLHRAEKGAPGVEAQIGEDGSYRFDGLAPGPYEITLLPGKSGTLVRERFEIAEGERDKRVDVTLPRGVFAGRVVDAHGDPVADANIVLEPAPLPAGMLDATGARAMLAGLAGRCVADKNGAFRLAGLAAGAYRVLYGKGGAVAATTLRLVGGEQKTKTLRLDAAGLAPVEIRAVGDDGKPVQAAFLLRGKDGNMAELLMSAGQPVLVEKLSGRMPRGSYRVYVSAPGYAAVQGRLVEARGEPIVIRLERGADVTLSFGVAGATVEIVGGDSMRVGPSESVIDLLMKPRTWRTDDSGTIRMKRVPRGTFAVRFNGKDIGRIRVDDRPLERGFDPK